MKTDWEKYFYKYLRVKILQLCISDKNVLSKGHKKAVHSYFLSPLHL